jgi:membrane protein implicated in regulation of membrane protease activity
MDIFSDPQSKLNMMKRVIITRMTPLLIIFFLTILPNLYLFAINSPRFGTSGLVGLLVYIFLFIIYVVLFVYCIRGFRKLRDKYKE